MNVSACLVTRGDVDMQPVIDSLPPEWEVVIWDNAEKMVTRSDGYAEVGGNLAVYGRYAAIKHATHDLIYVQDDDCIVSDPQAIVEQLFAPWDDLTAHKTTNPFGDAIRVYDDRVVCNMPDRFRHDFYHDHALVGFGAAFHRDAPKRAFDRWAYGVKGFIGDENYARLEAPFYRTCDIVFTGMTPRVLVDVAHEDREFASAPNRMWMQPTHQAERSQMLNIVREVLGVIDLLYVTWNRFAFTEATFEAMLANTDWSLFERLVVYDDTSEDGTWELLQSFAGRVPVPVVMEQHEFRSPVAMMNHYLRKTEATWFCKVDNDIMLPPGWSTAMVNLIMEGGRPIDLLGMEAGHGGRPDPPDWDGRYGLMDSSHIGGVGMMRVEAFRRCGPMAASGRYGFTQYQIRHKLTRGWISPSLLVPSLDRVPIDPWASLSDEYTEKGWQRAHPWPKYDPAWPIWWEWFTPDKKEEAA